MRRVTCSKRSGKAKSSVLTTGQGEDHLEGLQGCGGGVQVPPQVGSEGPSVL